MTRSDEQLCEDYCNSGDDESASELVRRYLPVVRRLVFSMVVDHAAADDITQDVMIRAIKGLGNFNGDSSLSTWMTRIALNTTYTFLDREKRRTLEPLPDAPVDRTFTRSPVHVAMGRELDSKIQEALHQLSPKLRAAIIMTAIQGVSPIDAAEVEQCPVATMHWRIHEARKQIRIQLREYVNESVDHS